LAIEIGSYMLWLDDQTGEQDEPHHAGENGALAKDLEPSGAPFSD
jgi:hypothetical protein